MGKSAPVFRGTRGLVRLKGGGTQTIRRGDEFPSEGLKADRDRFEEIGMLGEPFQYPEEPEDVTPAEALVANPEQESYTTPGEEVPSGITATSSNEELDTFVTDATVDDVLEAANDADSAQALLDAEIAVRGDDARKGVIEGLVAKGAANPGDDE